MAMTGFEQIVAKLLLMIVPDVIFWVVTFLALYLVFLAITKIPGSSSVFFTYLIVWVLAESFGSPFEILHMLMLAGTGILLVASILKIGNRG